MSKGKAPFLPPALQRTNSGQLKESLYTGECIVSAINYLRYNSKNLAHPPGFRAKLAATTYNTVVDNLIELMKLKGYPKISILNVTVLYNYLFMPVVDRKDIFNCIYKWADKGPCTIPAKTMRSLLTFNSSLDTATQKSVESASDNYFKTWDDITNPEIKLTESEFIYFKLVLAAKKGISIKKGVKANTVSKKACSNCWLCGTPIYIYKYKTTALNTCGEDEHVLPPGIGNLAGLLEPTYKATIKHFHDSILITQGLRASHAWCNQAKSDINFIKPPLVGKGTAKGWSLNQPGINEFLLVARQRLDIKSPKAPNDYLYSYDSIFARDNSEAAKNSFIAGMKTSIESHIGAVCNAANTLVVPTATLNPNLGKKGNNNTAYTSCIIRLIFNSCFIGKEYIFENFEKKWKSFNKAGGSLGGDNGGGNGGGLGGGNGAENLDSDLLSILCKEIMNEGENTCLTNNDIRKFNNIINNDVVIDDTSHEDKLELNEDEIEDAFELMNVELVDEYKDIKVTNEETNTIENHEKKINLPIQQLNQYYPALTEDIPTVQNFIFYDIEEQPINILSNIPADELNQVVWSADESRVNHLKSAYLLRETPQRISWREARQKYEREKERLIEASELTRPEIEKLREKIHNNKSSIRGIKTNIKYIKKKRESKIEIDDDIEIIPRRSPRLQELHKGGTKTQKIKNKKEQKQKRSNKRKKTRKQTRTNKRKKTRKQTRTNKRNRK